METDHSQFSALEKSTPFKSHSFTKVERLFHDLDRTNRWVLDRQTKQRERGEAISRATLASLSFLHRFTSRFPQRRFSYGTSHDDLSPPRVFWNVTDRIARLLLNLHVSHGNCLCNWRVPRDTCASISPVYRGTFQLVHEEIIEKEFISRRK